MKQIVLYTLFGLLLFSNCSKVVEFEQSYLEQKLVVNAILTTDSLVQVEVSTNKPIPGELKTFEKIADAQVKLFVDGNETEILNYSDSLNRLHSYNTGGIYIGNTCIRAGRSYQVKVSHPAYNEVASAVVTAVIPAQIKNISLIIDSLSANNMVEAIISIDDPIEDNNYYLLNVHYRAGKGYVYPNGFGDSTRMVMVMDYLSSRSPVESRDPVLAETNDADSYIFGMDNSYFTLFTDRLFNGREYHLRVKLKNRACYDILNTEIIDGGFYSISFELATLSKEVYLYLKSMQKFDVVTDGVLTEPVPVYTNIENGLGIIGIQSINYFKFEAGKCPIDGYEYSYGSYGY